MSDGIKTWVIYRSPSDYPGRWVLRVQTAVAGKVIADLKPTAVELTLEAVRRWLPWGLCNLGRQPGDDPVICEVWI